MPVHLRGLMQKLHARKRHRWHFLPHRLLIQYLAPCPKNTKKQQHTFDMRNQIIQ